MVTKTNGAKIMTPKELTTLRYVLPESWIKSAGMLRHRKKELARHLRKIHREWGVIPRV